ncbi:gas vesicle protein K [Spartinivicinus ruber]|uniref:gas vesicle protein K n=1 Tax=Spartinivicinus ruber TaxID=2683272 RepID=UPI0013D659BA|nr:gas vesicle protein K [Spartinivicinus ruber]
MSQQAKVSSDYLADFVDIVTTEWSDQKELCQSQQPANQRINVDAGQVKNGLGQLVLTLVKLLHELLERQAIRRMDAGSLTEEEIEQLGIALMQQAEEIDRLCEVFGLTEEDLNLDLGPLGQLL